VQVSADTLAGAYQSFLDLGHPLLEPAHLIVSYHDLTPVWLLANAGFMDGLPPGWQAEITELQAQMASRVNGAYLSREDEILRELQSWTDLSVVFEFSHIRNRVFNTMPELEHGADAQQRLARDLVEIMRRTA